MQHLRQLIRFAFGSCLLLFACGGDSSPADGGPDATQSEGGGPCVAVDGGLACDPAHIACGTLECDAGAQVCCINDGGAKQTCTVPSPTDGGKPPPNACTATAMACDEAANCPSGEICCGFVGTSGGFATSCRPSCGTGLQFCHGSAECVTGSCTVMPQCHGVTIETCGAFCP